MTQLTCPECGLKATPEEFSASATGECACPKCTCLFLVETSDDDDDFDDE